MNKITKKAFLSMEENKIQAILLIGMLLMLLILIAAPSAALFTKAFTDADGAFIALDNFKEYFESSALKNSLINSIFVSVVSSIVAVLLGFIYAYGISRTNMRAKKFFKYTATLPLLAPSMLYSIALIYLFGNKGIFTQLGIDIKLYGAVGIIISEIVFAFPQAFLILSVGLSMVDYRLYEAAEVLGASNAKKFFKITLPSIKYPLISSVFVTFIMCFTDFGAPKILGGNYNVLATDIYKQIIGQFNLNLGAAVSIIMLLPAVMIFIIDRLISKRQAATITSKSRTYTVKESRARDNIFLVLCTLIAAIIFLLIFTASAGSFIKIWPYNPALTLKHYKFDGLMNSGWDSYLNSIKISFLTAVGGTIFTFSNAYFIEKFKRFSWVRNAAYFFSVAIQALPGLVIGIAYIVFFNAPNNPMRFLYNTVWIIVLANIIHFYSVAFITSTSALKLLDPEYEVVAKSLKVPFYRLYFKVTVPMSMKAILEVAMYFFVNSMVTVSALIFLYTPKTQTASVSILKLSESGDGGSAAAMAVLVLATNIVINIIYETICKRILNKTQKWKAVKTA
jgi:iron(III) transport system permease protein